MALCSVREFEQDVFRTEGIRIVVRTPTTTVVTRYETKRKTNDHCDLLDLMDKICDFIGAHHYAVVDGTGRLVDPPILLGDLRKSYMPKE